LHWVDGPIRWIKVATGQRPRPNW